MFADDAADRLGELAEERSDNGPRGGLEEQSVSVDRDLSDSFGIPINLKNSRPVMTGCESDVKFLVIHLDSDPFPGDDHRRLDEEYIPPHDLPEPQSHIRLVDPQKSEGDAPGELEDWDMDTAPAQPLFNLGLPGP